MCTRTLFCSSHCEGPDKKVLVLMCEKWAVKPSILTKCDDCHWVQEKECLPILWVGGQLGLASEVTITHQWGQRALAVWTGKEVTGEQKELSAK